MKISTNKQIYSLLFTRKYYKVSKIDKIND